MKVVKFSIKTLNYEIINILRSFKFPRFLFMPINDIHKNNIMQIQVCLLSLFIKKYYYITKYKTQSYYKYDT